MGITEAIVGTIEVSKSLNEIKSSKLSFAKEALQMVVNVGDAIIPFIPLIGAASTIISEIIYIYQTAQYNKKICSSLLDRARLAELAIEQLIRRKKENEKNFKNEIWYKAFDRLVTTLGNMKDYAERVTQLQGISNYFKAKSISERFNELTNECDNVMKDLNFTIFDNEQQRQIDRESMKQDLALTNKFLEKIDGDLEKQDVKLALIYEEVKSLKSKIEKSVDTEAKNIEQNNLTEPEIRRESDSRGSRAPYLKRKIYMNAIEVACKPTIIDKNSEEYKSIQRQLAIYVKATQSPNVIRFYGLSIVDSETVMVLEWAELGDLRNYYLLNTITLRQKLNFVLHICRAIAYLNAIDIYHYDLRCKNVMVTRDLVAKLSNFKYSRTKDFAGSLADRIEMGRWVAPEKLDDPAYRYDHKCEIFSFGMLLWELVFERKPYEDKEIDVMMDFVVRGGREEIQFGPDSSEFDKNIQTGLEKVIRGAWNQSSSLRASISKLLIDIDTLVNAFAESDGSPSIQPIILNKYEEIPEYDNGDIDFDSNDFEPMIPIIEGIRAHKKGEHEKALKCFDAQADNQNSLGKYWKAFYLWEGLAGQKDKVTALNLYKEAADDGVVDAQFRYACGLLDKDIKLKYKVNPKDPVTYLRLAADNGSGAAQYQMGEAYLRGKLSCPEDIETAKLWYKRAALNGDKHAEAKLNELKISGAISNG